MNTSFKRIFLIVMDSVGIGASPDAVQYGDENADTLGHIAGHRGSLQMPNMGRLGLSNIRKLPGIEEAETPLAHFAKMQEASAGKDTMTGHWELMGLRINAPFRTFPDGFPDELITELKAASGRNIVGNKPASGTGILDELGEHHLRTGDLIVYTSADSVLQIAAHENIVSVEELYRICETARELTKDEKYMVGRVIARPFTGETGSFERTPNRRDYALKPFGRTVMNELKDEDFEVTAIGKITDIYDGEGVTTTLKTTSNMDGMDKLLETMDADFTGLSFLNLVDFDAEYGHRRDPDGYGEALEAFDERLPEVLEKVQDDDLLIITADHGNDPVHHGSDHTREYVPLLVHHPAVKKGMPLPLRETFADVGAAVAENFQVKMPSFGVSFLKDVQKQGGQ
ncbi:phosphopentomutase [Salibacterium lacus]|uniref:Phosphopentomutase n=1 Tax=Salibacterium lacus TaxID=1898109 RepID=A0ABW5T092_9BACI